MTTHPKRLAEAGNGSPVGVAAAAELSRTSLDRSLVTGVAWTGAIKWLSQILSWVSTLVVARILSPSDYGIVGMAATYVGLVQLVSEFGLSAAVVQQRDLTSSQIAKLGGLSIGLGVVFAVVSVLLAAPIAWFFGVSELQAVIVVMSTTFVIGGLQVLPRSLLTRDLRFATLGWIEGAEAVTLTATTISLALLGYGYWALVIGVVASRALATVLTLLVRRHSIAWPVPLGSIAAPLRLGAHVLTANTLWYAFRSSDLAIVGRVLGSVATGAYVIAFNLASVPVERLTGLVTRATPAIFAAVQNDTTALRRYLLGLTEGIAMVTMPVAVGLALVADEFIVALLGAKWQSAVQVLRLLALASVVRSVTPLLPQVLIATGNARQNTRSSVALAVTMPPLFLLGAQWGVEGVAWMWLLAYPLIPAVMLLGPVLNACDATLSQYFRSLWPAASASALMAAVVLPADMMLGSGQPPAVLLAAKVVVGAVAYVGVLAVAHRNRLAPFRRVLGLIRARDADDAVERLSP